MLAEIMDEAEHYLKKISSPQAVSHGRVLMDIRFNTKYFVEAIVLIHVNGELTWNRLSEILGYNFRPEHADVINDFFLRDDLFTLKKKKTGRDILSQRQITRVHAEEYGWYSDDLDYD